MDFNKCSDETLIDIYRKGDEAAIEVLFERYKDIVRKKAKAMYLAGGDSDDLIQEGMIGLYKAVRDYDDTKEAAFKTFASMCINRQLINAVAVSNRKKNIPLNTYVSFDMPAYPDEDNETRLVDILKPESEQNPEKLFIDREYSDSFKKKLFDRLSSFEKQVLQLYMEDNDYRQIAMLLGKTPKSIDNAIDKIEIAQEDCETREEILRDRLVEMYKAGDVTYLDVLLSSKSLTEFISSYFLMRQIVEYDNLYIEQIEREKNELEETKTKLEKQQKEIRTVKAKKEQTTTILTNKKILQKAQASKLTKAEKELQKEITEYKKEVYRIQSLIAQASGEEFLPIQYTGGNMIWPVAKEGTAITSYYEQREHPISGIVHYHSGIDIGNAYFGTPVVAAMDGYVSYAGWLGGYGNCVIINHGDGVSTLYGHGQAILTTLHKQVKQGDLIMEVGSTGNSTGPHLHFEVRINGYTVNPLLYVNEPT